MNPLIVNLWIAAGVAALCWLLSIVTREYSWVDRSWSVVPAVYLWVFAAGSDFDARVTLMACLVTLWAIRLTFNYARKGGYAPGGEDYRWKILRSRMPPWAFQIFNVLFIAGYQNVLLLAITLPAWTAVENPTSFGPGDVVAAVVFELVHAGETVADQQQWNFHRRKVSGQVTGFLDRGLFRYSRHPNFFCEIGQWWVIFAFGAIAAGTVWLWTIAGAVLLTLLFVGSTLFTESISAGRYPAYADYRRRTSMLVPLPPRSTAGVSN
jgi:steroid 5-alpha reductase family enzyme